MNPKLSRMTLTTGTRQFVVQLALEMMWCFAGSYFASFTPTTIAGIPAEWSAAADADPRRVLLFLHGGGYCSGSIVSHRTMASRAGQAAGMRTLALQYRLAPEHPFPAALDDARAAFEALLADGIAPADIAVGGDSAGGGLSLALMVSLRDAGRPEEALKEYGTAVESAPADEAARLGRAETLVRSGKYREARDLLEEDFKALPQSGLLAAGLARLLAACPDLSLRNGARALELGLALWNAQPVVPQAKPSPAQPGPRQEQQEKK